LSEPISIDEDKVVLGIDESGKGDFFGPLVVAGVLADSCAFKKLAEIGARDSKKLSDNRIKELARYIRENMPYSVVLIGPEKYNQLYERIRNLNRLLAWGHSRVIENVAEKNHIDLAISDKFSKGDRLGQALMSRGKEIKLIQEVRAEANLPVAAASIVARDAFVEHMKKLSEQYGCQLPLGAGTPVDKVARELVAKHGADILDKISKVHFKNYKRAVE